MKKIYLLSALFLFTVLNGFSQSATDVQDILEKLSAKVKSAKSVSTNFTLIQFDRSNHIIASSKGIVKIKNEKYYLKEDKTEIFSNGVQTWNFDGSTEVTVSKADTSDEDALSPRQILSGFNDKDFTSKLISSAGNSYEILLLPIDKRKNFKQVTIYISKSTSLISKAKINDKANNITQVSFSAINLNTIVPDSQFSFDVSKHPGVEIINQ